MTADPFLDAGMRGWIVNTAKKNYWRVASWYEFDDLVQDGYMCYYKCRNRYAVLRKAKYGDNSEKVQRRRIMALVKVAYHNHIATLAMKQSRLREQAMSHVFDGEDANAVWERYLPCSEEEATCHAMFANAPAEILGLIKVLNQDGLDAATYLRKRVGGRQLRETNDERFRRLLKGVPHTPEGLRKLVTIFDPDTPASVLRYKRPDGEWETTKTYCARLIDHLCCGDFRQKIYAYFLGQMAIE